MCQMNSVLFAVHVVVGWKCTYCAPSSRGGVNGRHHRADSAEVGREFRVKKSTSQCSSARA